MLLEFRVRNFRSIRDEQVLSFVASGGDKELAESHLLDTGLRGVPRAVRSVVVYGPNASGKSTILYALHYMRAVVAESATAVKPGQQFNVQPFRLDKSTVTAPSEFELSFVVDGVRYQYAFAMTQKRIFSESLVVYRTAKPTTWFERRLASDGENYEYEYSTHLKGSRKLWQDSTRENALFLSTAAQLNSELLGPVFQSIVGSITYVPAAAALDPARSAALIGNADTRQVIKEFLSSADISISDIEAVQRKGYWSRLVISGDGVAPQSKQETEFLAPVFVHSNANATARFELNEESDGTQRLFALAAPVLEALRDGKVLVVDELDSSLHALLVRRLLSMFHNPKLNAKGAQLLFSTHDTSLLDYTLFRRDQVWFTEKDALQATVLFPLTDFSARKHEAWERGYLAGRYGAVPIFGDLPRLRKSLAIPDLQDIPGSATTTTS